MSTMNVVVVSTDFRRATVKVTPGTYLIEVLETACSKLNLSSDKYLLKHKNKQLDLTNPIRTSNLSPGAKLELVVKSSSPTVVSVALKLPDAEAGGIPNGRLVEKFRSDTTLWKMLRHFESGTAGGSKRNFNFTARGVPQISPAAGDKSKGSSGQLYYEGPVLLVVGRELSSLTDFQKTLSQLGISGNVLITLSFKQTGSTLHEAMQQIEQFFKEETTAETTVEGASTETLAATKPAPSPVEESTTVTTPVPTQPLQPQPSPNGAEKTDADVDSNQAPPPTSSSQPSSPAGRAMQVFAAPTSSTPAAALTAEPDSTYQPTITHAQLHQQRLLEKSHNKRLPSDKEIAERAAADEAKLASIKEVSVKVRFPDNTSAQWTFGPADTADALYGEVRAVMAHPAQPFKLISQASTRPELQDASGPRHHRLIHDYRLEGRVLVTLVWADSVPANVRRAPFLKEDAARQARPISVPRPPKGGEEDEDESATAAASQQKKKPEKKGDGEGGVKLPKWLKLPGKK